MQANFPRVGFLLTAPKFGKRKKNSSSLGYVLHKAWNQAFSCGSRAVNQRQRNVQNSQMWCTCKIVVLLNKPIAFLAFSLPLPSPSSLLKLPNNGDFGAISVTEWSCNMPISEMVHDVSDRFRWRVKSSDEECKHSLVNLPSQFGPVNAAGHVHW